jgi:hypothetical protein
MYYETLQKSNSQQTIQLQHASNKFTNMEEKFSLLLESLKDSDEVLDKVKNNLEQFSAEGFKVSNNIQEISICLEGLSSICSRCKERIESLDMENNIFKADPSLLKPVPSNESLLKKSKTSQEDPQKKTYFISMAEPVMLSTHLYLEALQEKIVEVHELKRALVEVASYATDESV